MSMNLSSLLRSKIIATITMIMGPTMGLRNIITLHITMRPAQRVVMEETQAVEVTLDAGVTEYMK